MKRVGPGQFEPVYSFVQNGQTLIIKTKVETSWLLNPNRNFPLTIDPTVNFYPAAIASGTTVVSDYFMCGSYWDWASVDYFADYTTNTWLGCYYWGFCDYDNRALTSSIDVSSIPAGLDVTNVVYYTYIVSDVASRISAYIAKIAVSPTTATGQAVGDACDDITTSNDYVQSLYNGPADEQLDNGTGQTFGLCRILVQNQM